MTIILINIVLQHIEILSTIIWCLRPIEYVFLSELLELTQPVECEEQLAAQKKFRCTRIVGTTTDFGVRL